MSEGLWWWCNTPCKIILGGEGFFHSSDVENYNNYKDGCTSILRQLEDKPHSAEPSVLASFRPLWFEGWSRSSFGNVMF